MEQFKDYDFNLISHNSIFEQTIIEQLLVKPVSFSFLFFFASRIRIGKLSHMQEKITK
jgi:hypothetical protein